MMTINDQIKDEKLQYNIVRGSKNICFIIRKTP